MSRYLRQTILTGFGQEAQDRLAASHVVMVGAGGLGSPALQYLAAAGVGRITIVDHDRVEESNLHRQIVHTTASIGELKAESAARFAKNLNPDVTTDVVSAGWTVDNALELARSADVVVDGTDNFPTRYLVDDACALTDTTTVWGSVLQWQGRVSVFNKTIRQRDLFPEPPAAGSIPSCADAGVLGALCGVIGTLMATETLKILAGVGTPLIGTLHIFDALTARTQQIKIVADPARPPITDLVPIGDLPCSISPIQEVSGEEAFHKLRHDPSAILLDVRQPEECAATPAADARNIPLGELSQRLDALPQDGTIFVLCQSGVRSAKGARVLSEAGFGEVYSVRGGILAAGQLGKPRTD